MTDRLSKRAANNIKRIRGEKSLTQVQVAKKAGINSNYYAKVERGEIKPGADTYEQIARGLGVDAEEIFKK